MKKYKISALVCLAAIASAVFMSSCVKGNASQSYSNVYGYVTTSPTGIIYVNTSSGNQITWEGIGQSSTYHSGNCIKLSYSIDFTTLNGLYAAQPNVEATLSMFEPSTSSPIAVSDTIDEIAPLSYSQDSTWLGDNYIISLKTTKNSNQNITPTFYYNTAKTATAISASDSLIIDARVTFSAVAAGISNGTTNKSDELAVKMSDVRKALIRGNKNAGKSIPIYFRYYSRKTGKPSYSSRFIMQL